MRPAVKDFLATVNGDEVLGSVAANLGYILLDHQDVVNALRYLRIATEAYPDDPAVLNNYAIALKQAREFDAARDFYQKALLKDSSHLDIQLNYARLLVEEFADADQDKSNAIELLNKIKFVGSNAKASSEADSLLNQIRQ